MRFLNLADSSVSVWQLYDTAILIVSFREMAESHDMVTTACAKFLVSALLVSGRGHNLILASQRPFLPSLQIL